MSNALKISLELDPTGTSFHGTTIAVPAAKFAKFMGKECTTDLYKISSEWFCEFDGDVFCVYDWKLTSMYHPSLPNDDEMWSSNQVIELHIASKTSLDREFQFKQELLRLFNSAEKAS